jgi:hypothetical protein
MRPKRGARQERQIRAAPVQPAVATRRASAPPPHAHGHYALQMLPACAALLTLGRRGWRGRQRRRGRGRGLHGRWCAGKRRRWHLADAGVDARAQVAGPAVLPGGDVAARLVELGIMHLIQRRGARVQVVPAHAGGGASLKPPPAYLTATAHAWVALPCCGASRPQRPTCRRCRP